MRNSAEPKVSEEGGEEIFQALEHIFPLQLMEKTAVKNFCAAHERTTPDEVSTLQLQPMESHAGARSWQAL